MTICCLYDIFKKVIKNYEISIFGSQFYIALQHNYKEPLNIII